MIARIIKAEICVICPKPKAEADNTNRNLVGRGGERRYDPGYEVAPVSSIYIYIYMEWELPVTDRAKSEAEYCGHGGSKLRRFQSPCAIFTIHVNMKDRVGRLRLT